MQDVISCCAMQARHCPPLKALLLLLLMGAIGRELKLGGKDEILAVASLERFAP